MEDQFVKSTKSKHFRSMDAMKTDSLLFPDEIGGINSQRTQLVVALRLHRLKQCISRFSFNKTYCDKVNGCNFTQLTWMKSKKKITIYNKQLKKKYISALM